MSTEDSKWDAAYRAIREEATNNQAEVAERTKQVLFVLGDHFPLDMTLAAALFAAAVSGAQVLLNNSHGDTPTQPVGKG